MTRAAEGPEDLTRAVVENPDKLIPTISNVHVFLCTVARKGYPPSGTACAPDVPRAVIDNDVFLEMPHFIKNLDAIALPVTDIHQARVVNDNTMNSVQEHSAHTSLDLGDRALLAPLTQKMSVAIENDYTLVAIAVCYVYVAVAWIDRDTCGSIKHLLTRIHIVSSGGAVRGVELSFRADLKQQFSAIVRIFLDDSVLATTNPYVALSVDSAAV